jgi:hypothetical protein
MKKEVWLTLITIAVLIIIDQGVFAESSPHCLTAKPSIKLDLSINPQNNCFNIIPYFDCEMSDKTYIVIQNINCTEKLFYIFGNGQEQEVTKYPYDIRDTAIPQENGAEWTRNLYFEGNKENKFIISGKNLPENTNQEVNNNLEKNNRNYLYYLVGVVIVVLIGLYFIFRKRK